ncbi:MAG: metal ABC transporter permease [Alphaproteobacteria bacterium]|nr:metal ABC transporter permease [Alphaproteobacteria bacterium]
MILYDWLLSPFVEFSFMRRALAGSIALSFSAAPVGVFMMLRRMSLMGDAISHAILPGVAVGFLVFGLEILPMTIGGMIAGLVVALAAGLVARGTALKEDASLAAFYLISLALGVLIVSIKGSSVDLMHVLFGTVLALNDEALIVLGATATATIAGLAIILRPLIAEFVDPGFLAAVRGPGAMSYLVFLTLVVLNLVAGFQALGTLLAVGIMVLPAAAARFWMRRLSGMIGVAVLIAVLSCIAGLLVSYHWRLASGPCITLSAGAIYLGSLLAGPAGGIVWQLLPHKHRAA